MSNDFFFEFCIVRMCVGTAQTPNLERELGHLERFQEYQKNNRTIDDLLMILLDSPQMCKETKESL
jgi:hypothetical protein